MEKLLGYAMVAMLTTGGVTLIYGVIKILMLIGDM